MEPSPIPFPDLAAVRESIAEHARRLEESMARHMDEAWETVVLFPKET